MYFKRAIIHGFGPWNQEQIDFSDGFVCLYGKNESGKSSLQQFLLFMLFGLPPKQRDFYRSKTSGQMGGRLILADAQYGDITIERFDGIHQGQATCYLSDGSTYDENWLIERLNGFTKEIYESIFSFSANDLQMIRTMDARDLGEILLGIGLTGATNIYHLEKNLDKDQGALFKRNGKVPVINQQLEKVEQLHRRWLQARDQQGSYRQRREDKLALEKDIEQLKEKIAREKANLVLIEQQKRIYPLLVDYDRHQEEMAKFSHLVPFPANGIERLRALKESLLAVKSEYDVIEKQITELNSTIETLEKKMITDALYERGQNLLQEKNAYDADQQLRSEFRTLLENINQKIEEQLKTLNVNKQLILQFLGKTYPFHIEVLWKNLKDTDEQLLIEQEKLEHDQRVIQDQINALKVEKKAIEAQLLKKEERERYLRKLDEAKQSKWLETMQKDMRQAVQQRKKEQNKQRKRAKILFTISIVLSVISGANAYIFNYPIWYQVALILILLGFGQWLMTNRIIKNVARSMTTIHFKGKIETSTDEEIVRKINLDEDRRQRIKSIDQQLKTLHIQSLQWEERQRLYEQKNERFLGQLHEQEETYPFLKDIHVTYWPEFYDSLKKLNELILEKEEVSRDNEKVETRIQAYENELILWWQTYAEQRDLTRLDTDPFNVNQLDQQMMVQKEYRQQLDLMVKEHTLLLKRKKELKPLIKSYEDEIQTLFTSAAVETEESFYEQAENWETYQQLQQSLKYITDQIEATFSQDLAEELLKQRLNKSELEAEYERTKENIQLLNDTLYEQQQQLADLKKAIHDMESSEEFSEMTHQLTFEKEKLNNLAKDWAVLKISETLLHKAKQAYRDQYLTQVIDLTTDYFKKLTDGAYVKIYPPTENKPFQVENHQHIKFTIDELSQGTIDQLYVCLRLAVSEIFSDGYRIPFIIDDAFVHFDNDRTKRMVELLRSLNQRRQVLLFTCKSDMMKYIPEEKMIHIEHSPSLNR